MLLDHHGTFALSQSRILDLAEIISQGTAKINDQIQLHGLPKPSFEPKPSQVLPKTLLQLQDAVIDATTELRELLIDPFNAIHGHGSTTKLVTLNALQKFDIPNCVSPGERATFGQVAERTGLSEPVVKSLLRHAMTMMIFCEPEKGVVSHTCRSALLREAKYRNFLRVGMEEMAPAAIQTANAMATWPLSEEPSQTGFCLANNTDQPMYSVLGQDPNRAKRFADTMTVFTSGRGFEVDHVVKGFQWDSEKEVTVVDVGGSDGNMAIALAKAYPMLKIVVQDLESASAGGINSIPDELSKRVSFMTHNFFEPQPVSADIYFFRWIFHNWSDKYCLQILRSLIPALRPGARIFVNDTCMPEPGTIPSWKEQILRTMNLNMTMTLNGRERDADEWESLFKQADPRFRLQKIKQPEGSSLAMIEVVWEG